MTKPKISDVALAMLGAQASRWPSADVNVAWRTLHEAIEAIRLVVRETDIALVEKAEDRNLSDIGKVRALNAIGLAGVNRLRDLAEVRKADASVARMIEHAESGIKVPDAPSDPAIGAEIRAFLAAKGEGTKGAFHEAMKRRNDPEVVAAIKAAPAFLSGLTDEQKNTVLASAATAMFPGPSRDRNALTAARDFMHATVKNAEAKIAQLAQLRQTTPGEWGAAA
jgi:hypothetical protein